MIETTGACVKVLAMRDFAFSDYDFFAKSLDEILPRYMLGLFDTYDITLVFREDDDLAKKYAAENKLGAIKLKPGEDPLRRVQVAAFFSDGTSIEINELVRKSRAKGFPTHFVKH